MMDSSHCHSPHLRGDTPDAVIAVADVVAVAGAVLVVHGTDSNVLHLHRSTLHSVGHFESADPIDRVHVDRGEIAIDSNVSIHDDRVVDPNGGRHRDSTIRDEVASPFQAVAPWKVLDVQMPNVVHWQLLHVPID